MEPVLVRTLTRTLLLPVRAVRSVHPQQRCFTRATSKLTQPQIDPAVILSKPTWSVRSLVPPTSSNTPSTSPEPTTTSSSSSEPTRPTLEDGKRISPKQLHHLLRLSALPLPKTPEEEAQMINTLQSQLHFVRDVQSVDTTGVEPLRSIRDETEEGLEEATISLDTLREALSREAVFGYRQRPKRRPHETDRQKSQEVEDWDVLGTASQKAGRYFVVRSGKGKPTEQTVSLPDDTPR
ncbi:hypothetical protein QBC46DRAFT_2283 [Diplogelasinospora grovesii]|uniref:Glutamyl-tRNA amidotransferase complex subunit Gta3 domain-containing protein n=1 Tax=Diplogelasinospora grovesii TaxID=303347 RepID=A0AAN6NLG1_9PEZI|nr:hypothetical protein QBC46DRAFT_2283 [Diplogelasinospora grovesii]